MLDAALYNGLARAKKNLAACEFFWFFALRRAPWTVGASHG
jgi:hypothetical protein